MEPRFFKRGNHIAGASVEIIDAASMEPRFFKRGNGLVPIRAVTGLNSLQWNHVFSNVEIARL